MNALRIASPLPPELETLVTQTIGALLAVHRELGPGMSETVYGRACTIELGIRGIPFEAERDPSRRPMKGRLRVFASS